MRRVPWNSTAGYAGKFTAVFAVAILLFLLLTAGCTSSQPAPEPVTTLATTVQTMVTTLTIAPTMAGEVPGANADKAFADAADACYRNTSVITNISTQLAFATCMKDTPLPLDNCARNFRYYALKYTNEDPTSAGFVRETNNLRLAREAFLRGEGYDGIRQEYAPCGNATLIQTSIVT